jgi:perosamine synthetase
VLVGAVEKAMSSRLYSIPRFALPYTPSDFAAGWLALFQGAPPPNVFDLLGDSPKFWTRSGRQALRMLLTALNLKPDSGVALPLFTDPSLVTAILAANHRPVFIDVDPQTLTIDPTSLHAARGAFSAVVAVHLFGHMADMPALLEAAPDVPVIEDAAHAPLSFLNGRMAGDFGLASFYSFASTKYWPAGGGGLAVVHDRTMARRLSGRTQGIDPSSRLHELKALILQGAKAAIFHRRLYGIFGRPMRRWAEKWALLEPSLDLKVIQRAHAAVACRQTLRLPQRVEQQRTNSLRLLSQLAEAEDVVLPRERPGARYNYHLFPVLLRNHAERAAVRAAMWRQFVDTSTIYSGVVEACRKLGYRGGCPVSESIADRLITLPNYTGLSEADIANVGRVFLTSLAGFRNTRPRYPALSFGVRSPGKEREANSPLVSRLENTPEPRP